MMKRSRAIAGAVLQVALLLAPMALAFGLVWGIQQVREPLRNAYPPAQAERESAELNAALSAAQANLMRDRTTIAVLLELFVLTLLVRPWEFPWRARRWGAAGALLAFWSAFMFAAAQHSGRLFALHTIVLVMFGWLVFPAMTLVLATRRGWQWYRRRQAATAAKRNA